MSDSTAAYDEVNRRIAAAAVAASRDPSQITLVAVTKTHGPEIIQPLLKAGHRVYGENRVQEAQGKWPDLKRRYADIELHLIGPLQSNKAREAVSLFDVIESVDREKIARVLAGEMARQDRWPELLVQVNTGLEAQKAGIAPDEAKAFVQHLRYDLHLNIRGLMCIPPFDQPPISHFQQLAGLAQELALPVISMGMSNDFEQAIACGATHVRVGSALFGART